ncbi:putative pentatricopeptide repeat-containing protein [Vigna angularis]|uniref:PROP1-like PPR domain-containing protein n=2 Tax=Phaseolus angularis TaxID=3914 RepID=A0A0S3SVH4_PHAAN|nr:putative pentatricopeptide repeat-containing protein At1g53330 [Vigna angularis]XP_017442449.1 putative pentatricopeptide repeat-containing protein At1g53330 [Vigna angularis]XP_017442450.1 putative pentatricopeptide repeat-containing protein At1g53330 [Vigna angularis]XP_052724410.1 putative pentatricopeptide repeat-containing protein At1g53330 [Vigna angularis]XP_052724411.1 putative pentatricopeptide repeat-containing protein At1g53330 [Vigna angularis]XP_052724412.1 putative pentatricop
MNFVYQFWNQTTMSCSKPISSFRLTSLLRSQKDPSLALQLFLNPNPNHPSVHPFRHSLCSYDLIITKLARAKMFPQMEDLLNQLHTQTRFPTPEPLLRYVIAAYARAGLPSRALRTFLSMPAPSLRSFNSLLHSLLACRDFASFTRLLPHLPRFCGPDACSYNILIHACSLTDDRDRAWKLFNEMLRRGVRPNQITFGTLINLLCKSPQLHLPQAFKVKEEMDRVFKIKPNVFVYTSLIKAVGEVGDFDSAVRLKDEMVRNNLKLDVVVYNTLVSGFLKGGKKDIGFRVLEEMKTGGVKPNSVTCNVLIGEFCREGKFEEAYRILNDGLEGVKPDVFGYNVVIGWLCEEGKWREADDLFRDMPRRQCVPDVVTYRTLFDGLCQCTQFEEAGLVLEEMIFKGYVPRSSRLNEFVGMVCKEGDFELLGKVLSSLVGGGFYCKDVWKTLVLLVCQSEKLLGAFEHFDELVLA